MAAGDLTFGSFTICTAANGDAHNRIDNDNIPRIRTADVSFHGAAGREIKILGNQDTGETARQIVYGGPYSVIYKDGAGIGTIESYLYGATNSIKALLTSTTSSVMVATLVDKDQTFTGMRLVSFTHTHPQKIGYKTTDKFMIQFTAVFQQYTV